jgi:hypothetical protein
MARRGLGIGMELPDDQAHCPPGNRIPQSAASGSLAGERPRAQHKRLRILPKASRDFADVGWSVLPVRICRYDAANGGILNQNIVDTRLQRRALPEIYRIADHPGRLPSSIRIIAVNPATARR